MSGLPNMTRQERYGDMFFGLLLSLRWNPRPKAEIHWWNSLPLMLVSQREMGGMKYFFDNGRAQAQCI